MIVGHEESWVVQYHARSGSRTSLSALRRPAAFALVILSSLAMSMAAPALGNVEINDLVIAETISDAEHDEVVSAVRAFYDFWNTGEQHFLKRAIAASFIDRTLPPGRPQGPEGPTFASRQFRAAVPDLHVRVEKMIVAGHYVTVHMTFTGHFTGRFGQTQGEGQPISFIATDLLKVEQGRITDNWHIEDNLTLFQQMGVVSLSHNSNNIPTERQ